MKALAHQMVFTLVFDFFLNLLVLSSFFVSSQMRYVKCWCQLVQLSSNWLMLLLLVGILNWCVIKPVPLSCVKAELLNHKKISSEKYSLQEKISVLELHVASILYLFRMPHIQHSLLCSCPKYTLLHNAFSPLVSHQLNTPTTGNIFQLFFAYMCIFKYIIWLPTAQKLIQIFCGKFIFTFFVVFCCKSTKFDTRHKLYLLYSNQHLHKSMQLQFKH